ncbi:MAG: hypothetical protein ABEH65_01845 [Halobacteriales archaeon]
MAQKRPWLAGLLALLYPGLGHLYLRAWLRAIAWFGLAFLTVSVIIPESVLTAFQNGGITAMIEASQSIPFTEILPLFVIRILNVIDAYWLAIQRNRQRTSYVMEANTCPNCGKELDEELSFCPWCTVELSEYHEQEQDETDTDSAIFR